MGPTLPLLIQSSQQLLSIDDILSAGYPYTLIAALFNPDVVEVLKPKKPDDTSDDTQITP